MYLKQLHELSGHDGIVWNTKWHPEGNILASCGEDKTIRLWGLSDNVWKLKTLLQDGHQKTIREVSWSPCGKFLASASFDTTVSIWDNLSGEFECNATLEGHENEVKSVTWSSSGRYLATCSRDKSVWVWSVEKDEYECEAVLNAHSQDVKRVVWHPTEELLASASYDNTIKLFKEDPSDCEWINVATLSSHESTVWSIAFDKTGSRLVSSSEDSTVKIWQEYLPGNRECVPTVDNHPTWKCVCTLSGYHNGTIYDVAWCHNTGLIATACSDNTIRLFKETDNSNVNEPCFELVATENDAHNGDVNCVRWNPKERGVLSSCGDDSTMKVWILDDSLD